MMKQLVSKKVSNFIGESAINIAFGHLHTCMAKVPIGIVIMTMVQTKIKAFVY